MRKGYLTGLFVLLLAFAMLLGGCSSAEEKAAPETEAHTDTNGSAGKETEAGYTGSSITDMFAPELEADYISLDELYSVLRDDPSVDDLRYEGNRISFTMSGVRNEVVEEWLSDTEVVWHTTEGDHKEDLFFDLAEAATEEDDYSIADSWISYGGAGTVYTFKAFPGYSNGFSARYFGYIYNEVREPEPCEASIIVTIKGEPDIDIIETREYAKEELPDVFAAEIAGIPETVVVFDHGEIVLNIPTFVEEGEGFYSVHKYDVITGASFEEGVKCELPDTCFLYGIDAILDGVKYYAAPKLINSSGYDIEAMAETPFVYDPDTDKFYGIDKKYEGYFTQMDKVVTAGSEEMKDGRDVIINPNGTDFSPEPGKRYKLEGTFEKCNMGRALRVTGYEEPD